MIQIRKAKDRGHFDMGWLNTFHTFSFGDYYDPQHMGFSDLRVINEDFVAPQTGFPRHGHRDMEIVTYVLEGSLQHKDSMGNGSTILPGEVQRMSAGRGVQHSEANQAKDPVHLLQIWILPEKHGIEPSYEQKSFSEAEKKNRLRLVASRDGRDGSVVIHQNARIYATLLDSGYEVSHELAAGRKAWVQVARGSLELNGEKLSQGDGAAVSAEKVLKLKGGGERAEVLVFDLA